MNVKIDALRSIYPRLLHQLRSVHTAVYGLRVQPISKTQPKIRRIALALQTFALVQPGAGEPIDPSFHYVLSTTCYLLHNLPCV